MVPMSSTAPVPMDNFQPSYLSELRREYAVLMSVQRQYCKSSCDTGGTKPVVNFYFGRNLKKILIHYELAEFEEKKLV